MNSDLPSLVARRLCHDFAGPVGAIGAALDMLAEVVGEQDAELVTLVADSAGGLSAALRLYRFALAPSAEPVGGGTARAVVVEWLKTRDAPALDWPDGGAWPAGIAELTAGLVMCAAETAPRGGTLTVAAGSVRLTAATITLPDGFAAVLAGTAPATTTRLAIAGCLAAQAAALGGGIAVEAAQGELALRYHG